eukprot:TRINITY_DN19022_c0_g1_i1.p1 TRINITY_DN19022_c0_g1~~TRINITY_DN19022_c0_g1_i1.p1  ORF type:complete len:447 (+),score=116.26 TRINITY_DN19022_c0_g1_i1:86-1342(+)
MPVAAAHRAPPSRQPVSLPATMPLPQLPSPPVHSAGLPQAPPVRHSPPTSPFLGAVQPPRETLRSQERAAPIAAGAQLPDNPKQASRKLQPRPELRAAEGRRKKQQQKKREEATEPSVSPTLRAAPSPTSSPREGDALLTPRHRQVSRLVFPTCGDDLFSHRHRGLLPLRKAPFVPFGPIHPKQQYQHHQARASSFSTKRKNKSRRSDRSRSAFSGITATSSTGSASSPSASSKRRKRRKRRSKGSGIFGGRGECGSPQSVISLGPENTSFSAQSRASTGGGQRYTPSPHLLSAGTLQKKASLMDMNLNLPGLSQMMADAQKQKDRGCTGVASGLDRQYINMKRRRQQHVAATRTKKRHARARPNSPMAAAAAAAAARDDVATLKELQQQMIKEDAAFRRYFHAGGRRRRRLSQSSDS